MHGCSGSTNTLPPQSMSASFSLFSLCSSAQPMHAHVRVGMGVRTLHMARRQREQGMSGVGHGRGSEYEYKSSLQESVSFSLFWFARPCRAEQGAGQGEWKEGEGRKRSTIAGK